MEENKKKNPLIWVLFILLLIAVGIGGWYLGTKMANSENKTSKEETKKEENKKENQQEPEETNELVYLNVFLNGDQALHGIYEDGTAKKISDKVVIDRFTVDEDIVYYTNPKGNLFSINLNKPEEEPKSYNVTIDDYYFSVVKDKVYYIETNNTKVNAVTVDLNTGKATKEKLKVVAAHVPGAFTGTVVYFSDEVNVSIKPYYYSYDFTTNTLTKLNSYDNTVSIGKDYNLFSKNNGDFCAFDVKENKELFCINYDDKEEHTYPLMPTVHDGKIYTKVGNQIKECTGANECNKTVYTLTNEEAKAPYLGLRYIGEHLFLSVGLNEECPEGCMYDITVYDLSKDHQKANFISDVQGYYEGLYIK